jgi:hypothetical protein
MADRQAQRESFLVRIWQEQGQPAWKGWVQHVGSGESALLDNVEELSTFVKRWTTGPRGEQGQGLR